MEHVNALQKRAPPEKCAQRGDPPCGDHGAQRGTLSRVESGTREGECMGDSSAEAPEAVLQRETRPLPSLPPCPPGCTGVLSNITAGRDRIGRGGGMKAVGGGRATGRGSLRRENDILS
eukprot:scaffold137697_cov31-Tisochrysis_lutea.AAC.1